MLDCHSGLRYFRRHGQEHTVNLRPGRCEEPHDLSGYCKMFTENETKETFEQKDSQPLFEPSTDQQSATQHVRVQDQSLSDCLPSHPASEQSCTLSPLKSASPNSADKTTSAKEVVSSSPYPSRYTEGTLRQLHNKNLHFPWQQQQKIDEENSQNEREEYQDVDVTGGYGKVEVIRRYREFVPDVEKDDVYWEKRRKNNEAARRSREKRRINDIVLAGRINILEQDNSRLRRELVALKKKFHLPEGHVYDERNIVSRQPNIQSALTSSPVSDVNSNSLSRTNKYLGPHRKMSPQGSPPPLLAVTDNMPMGFTVFASGNNQGLPYFVTETTNLNQNGCLKTRSSSLEIGLYNDQQMLKQQSSHPSYIKETVKEIREARDDGIGSISNDEGVPLLIDPSLMSMFKRSSVLSFPQYFYSNTQVTPYSCTGFPPQSLYHLQNAYDNHAIIQAPSVFNNGCDDNCDEPLQLTVRRDSNVSKVNTETTNKTCKESISNAIIGEKTEAAQSSFGALNLHHKPHVQDAVTPKAFLPATILPSSSVMKQSYPDPSILNGLANHSDSRLHKAIPLSLATSDLPIHISHEKFASIRSRKILNGSKCFDPVYLERRRKNNEAARKCRENRKSLIKLNEAKSTCLETQNRTLKVEMTCLQNEMKQLKDLFKNKQMESNTQQETNLVES